jgi:hypothetical protein
MGKEYVEPPRATEPAAVFHPGPTSLAPDPVCVDFLLRCLSVTRHPSPVSRQPPPDWTAVLALADDHGLTPLLYKRLKEANAQDGVPADEWKRLRRAYLVSAARNTRLFRELGKVLQRLRSSDVTVIVLKGGYLAEAVYGDAALRPMVDVDLLVREADLGRAQAVLLDMGGVHQQFEDIESHIKWRYHLPQLVVGDLAVEIHWTIAPLLGPVRVSAAGLWDRARPATIAGVEVLAPCPEVLLLHSCLHACYQEFLSGGLRSLCDVTETIRRFRDEIDWAHLVELAREWGAFRYAGLILHLAGSLLGAAVPDAVLEQLVPGGLARPVFEAARQSVLTRTGYGQWQPFLDKIHTPSFGDTARLSWRRVFLSREEMAATYPASRNARYLYLYYVRRVGHLVWSYTTHTLRRALLMLKRGRDPQADLVRWLNSEEPR